VGILLTPKQAAMKMPATIRLAVTLSPSSGRAAWTRARYAAELARASFISADASRSSNCCTVTSRAAATAAVSDLRAGAAGGAR